MSSWDSAALRNEFATTAANAERYANELSARIKRDAQRHDSPFVRETHDEHFAKWFVYDSFAFSNALTSRKALVAEAKRRLAAGFGGRAMGCYDREDFDRHWNQQMQGLIDRYEKA